MALTGIREFFFPWTKQKENFKNIESLCLPIDSSLAYKAYAIQIAISRIANSIAMANFETYQNGEIYQGNTWWLLNFEPNVNQNKAAFWQIVLNEMVFSEDGALIIQDNNGNLICADSYQIREKSLYENAYQDIHLYGGGSVSTSRFEKEVLHLTISNSKVKGVIDDVYRDYGKLIGGSISNYNRGNAMKVIVKIGAMFDQFKRRELEDGTSEYDFILDDIMENRMRGLLSDQDSATPIEDGIEIVEMQSGSNTRSGTITTRDITATFDDIMNMVADAFLIPRGLMKGDVADVEAMTKNYINLCINPICEMIENEINRKLYGKNNVLNGTKLRIDTSTILTRDPTDFASSAEAMFRIGAYSTNDVRRKMGEEPIAEDWADKHYVTKNYERTDHEETQN